MGRVWVGTSGYVYRDWAGSVYPPELPRDKWLSYYARHFSTVEINATFYRGLPRETLAEWRRSVPAGFRFALKGHRFVTHLKRLRDVEEPVARFFAAAAGLGDGLACVLWQFPARFVLQSDRENLRRLERFVALLPTTCHQAVEVRDASWFTDDVFDLLDAAGVGLVRNDSPAFPAVDRVTGRCAYVRFHGPGALYASSYDDADLAAWADRVCALSEQREVYCYFNNDAHAFAVHNARRLAELVGR